MATSPAVAAKILRNFSLGALGIVGGVFAAYELFGFASRKQMGQMRGQLPLRVYNAVVRPEQDRLDTIFDRTKLLEGAKERKPWNRSAAEKERPRW